ncbi:hypothetical protein FPV67DRAFT_1477424 [Lyophyllum atratum]|nr:hypothetical protein FPV67DRAFT_1477424 [Lyophyllum atratum]
MGPLPVLLGLFFGSLGYGINIVTFFICILKLLVVGGNLKSRHETNYPMTGAAVSMFIIATCDIVVEVCQDVTVFVDKNFEADPRVGGGGSQWWAVSLFSFFVAQMTLGDIILIYRCFIVWNRTWKVIVAPIVLSLAAVGCGVSVVIIALTTYFTSDRGRITPLITSMLTVTLASNFLSSFLIVFRIWGVHRESARYKMSGQDDPLPRAIRVTVEAGLIYTTSLIVLLAIHVNGGGAQHTVSRLIVQIIGIAFNLVISCTTPKFSDSHILSIVPEVPPQPMVISKEVVISRDPPEESRKRSRIRGQEASTERQRSAPTWKHPELDINA